MALAIRLFVAVEIPNSYAPDEIGQYLEQAHRLVFGQGIVPWEFQVGLRSWLIPLLLVLPMGLAHWFTPAPQAGLMLIRILLCFASLPIVWCAAKWGGRFYGTPGAWIAGVLTALWPDLWLMAPHPLEEALSTDTLIPAIYLVETCRGKADLKSVSWAGFLLGLTFALREQLAPAVAIAGVFLCSRDIKRWLVAVSVAAIPVFCAGLLDWYTWGQMFRSFWMNIYLNVILGIAANYFSSSPPIYYLLNLLYDWLWGLFFVGYFAWLGARKLPVAGLVTVAIIATHSIIEHKELRFIFPAMALLVPLAGVGVAGVYQNRRDLKNALLTAGILTGPYMSPLFYMMVPWQISSFGLCAELAAAHPCLVSIQVWNQGFWPMPQLFDGKTRFTSNTFNRDGVKVIEADAIIAPENDTEIPPGFTRQSCAPESWTPFKKPMLDVCFWTRPISSCQAGPVAPVVMSFPPNAAPFIIRDQLTDGR